LRVAHKKLDPELVTSNSDITRVIENTKDLVGVLYPEYRGPLVTAQKYGHRLVPSGDKWLGNYVPRTAMAPPLLAKEERPPT
jgi:hypothetical protein